MKKMIRFGQGTLSNCVMPIMCLMICLSEAFEPVDNYLINCGSHTNTSVGGRIFAADNTPSSLLDSSKFVFLTISEVNQTLAASLPELQLYMSGIVFPETSKYTFPIRKKGRHWIRLYFSSLIDRSADKNCSTFSVYAQNYLILSQFTVNTTGIIKEFLLHVTSDVLNLTFVPFRDSIATLNAFEVVSVPDELIGASTPRSFPSRIFTGFPSQALETIIHANIGGPAVSPQNDTLWRTWLAGQDFLVHGNRMAADISNVTAVKYAMGGPSEDIAPASVYGTAAVLFGANSSNINNSSLQWEFHVEPGFQYLIRFHLCSIKSEIRKNLNFGIFVFSWLVSRDSDIGDLSNGVFGSPYYFDVVTDSVRGNKIGISITPSPFSNTIAILNGIEIMKFIINPRGNTSMMLPNARSRKSHKLGTMVSVIIVLLAVLTASGTVLVFTLRSKINQYLGSHCKSRLFTVLFAGVNGSAGGNLCSSLAQYFPFIEIEEATNKFDEKWVVGVGGFGKVYRGALRDGRKVAVKRSNPQSLQGLAEFRTEIELLSQLRHCHLVSLIGYCDERNEMILIYEFMENGALRSHLYGSNLPSLGWKKRLEICTGAAKGLHYLHTGFVKPVIHRDVKSANILLDKNLVARVADFGLSRTIMENDQTHVSTAVRGTFGYLDPEYFRRRRLTAKSDVYSFGVVLLEVLCARPAIDAYIDEDMDDLAQWAMKHHNAGQLENILDPRLVGEISSDSLVKFMQTAEKCLADHGTDRPSMEEVVANLEHSLQLQEADLV